MKKSKILADGQRTPYARGITTNSRKPASHHPPDPHARAQNPPADGTPFETEADHFWRSDWRYLATADVQNIDAIKAKVKGLALPKAVIDKIYYSNAHRVFWRLPQK